MSSVRAAAGGPRLSFAACIALCLIAPLNGLAQGGLAPILPQLTEHFADEPNAGVIVRLMVSGGVAAMIFGALACSALADRVGQLRLLIGALAIYVVAGVAGFFIDDIYLMVASRMLLGAVIAAAAALGLGIITTRVAADQRDKWIGFFTVGGTLGAVASVIAVGALATLGWRYAFLPYLIALPVGAFIIAVFRPAQDDPAARTAAAATATESPGGGVPWGKMALGAVFGAACSAVAMFIPYHLAEVGLGSPADVGIAMATSTAVGGATSFSFGLVRRYLSAIPVFYLALGLIMSGLTVLALAHNHLLLFLGMGVFGGGIGLLPPNFFSACAAATPPELRTGMIGQVRGGFYAGPLIAQPFLEVAMQRSGSSAAILGIAAIAAIGIVLVALFRRTFDPIPL